MNEDDRHGSAVGPPARLGSDVSLHIERLVLDGVPVPSSAVGLLQVAMQDELSRLLSESGLSDARDGARRSVTASDVQLTEKIQPADFGKQIAQSIYQSLAETT